MHTNHEFDLSGNFQASRKNVDKDTQQTRHA